MQQAEVHRGVEDKKFVIVTDRLGGRVSYVDPMAGPTIDVCTMKSEQFAKKFVLSNQNPAHAARVWIAGHKKISDRARAKLDIISQTEYTMTQEAQAPVNTDGTAAPAAPAKKSRKKVATGEAKPAEPPKLDAEGNPIPAPVKKRKAKPAVVPYTLDQRLNYVAPNPKRAGCAAFARYAKYAVGKSFTELIAEGLTRPDFAYDLAHGFIKADEPAPAATPAA
jgi:hypothetical protein